MARPLLDDLLEELGLRLRHTFGSQLIYLGTTTPVDEFGSGDVDVLIVLSQLSDAHIRLVWNVVSSVRHTWNVFLDCRMRTTEDVLKQPLLEQFLLKTFLRDCYGLNPFRDVAVARDVLSNECRLRIAEQEDRILGLLPSAIADVGHLRGIGTATFEAVHAFLVMMDKSTTSKDAGRAELVRGWPAFQDINAIYKGYRNPTAVSDVPSYVATALGIVKHLSYRAQGFSCAHSVLLVNAPSSLLPHPLDEWFGYDANMPLGLLCLGAHLRTLEVPVRVLDAYAMNMTAMGTVDAIVREYNLPKVVGFNPSSPNIHVVHAIAKYLKRISNDIQVVVGGPHATLATAHALSSPHIDYAVAGEGEIPFGLLVVNLLRGDRTADGIPGVYVRRSTGEITGSMQDSALPLDTLPLPAFDLLPLKERYFIKRRRAFLHTSRGCAFRCSFCSVPKFWGGVVREIPINVVLDHVAAVQRDLAVEEVQIVDDNFSHHSGRRIKEFCDGLAQRQLQIRWKCQVRADQLDTELIALMLRSGCFEVDVGIESGNARVQDVIGKKLDLAKARDAVKNLRNANIVCKAFFILGFPSETWSEMQDSINFAVNLKSLGLRDVAFFPAMPFPGTALADYAADVLKKDITQGAIMDDTQKYVGSYALARLRKYAAMPEVSLNELLKPRELRLLCAFGYTSFESGTIVNDLKTDFSEFAKQQEAMNYAS